MRTALRVGLILLLLQYFFSSSFAALESTATSTLHAIGTAAELSRDTMIEHK
jgi:hypothetical protein